MVVLNILFITSINLLIYILFLHKYKIYSLFLFFLAFIYNFTFSINNIYIPFWIPIAFFYGVYLFFIITKKFKIKKPFVSINDKLLFYFFIIFASISILSLPYSIDKSMSFRYILKIILLIMLYFFLKKLFLKISYKNIRKVFFIIYVILVISAILQFTFNYTYLTFVKEGFFNFLISSDKQNYLSNNGLGFLIGHWNNIRISLNFLTPHILGIVFLFFSILVIYECKNIIYKIIFILLSLSIFIIIDSYTSTISFILILLYLFVKRIYIYIPIIFLFIYKYSFFIQHLHTMDQRFILWDYAFKILPNNLFGYGINTTKILLENFNAFTFKLDKFHNIFIDLYMMVGPLGTGIFIFYLAIFYYLATMELRLSLLILIFVNIFDDFFFDNVSMCMFICFEVFTLYFIKKEIFYKKRRIIRWN